MGAVYDINYTLVSLINNTNYGNVSHYSPSSGVTSYSGGFIGLVNNTLGVSIIIERSRNIGNGSIESKYVYSSAGVGALDSNSGLTLSMKHFSNEGTLDYFGNIGTYCGSVIGSILHNSNQTVFLSDITNKGKMFFSGMGLRWWTCWAF